MWLYPLEVKLDTTMISAMLRSGTPRNALLVLSCSLNNEGTTPTKSTLEIADKLKLCDISCPWQVH